jgi:hypothetical protein
MKKLFFPFFVTPTWGEDILVPLQFEFGLPQISFRIQGFESDHVGGDEPSYERSGYVNFETASTEHPIRFPLPDRTSLTPSFCIIDALVDQCVVRLQGSANNEYEEVTWEFYHHRVSGGFGSEFLRAVGSYMLTPNTLVIAPRDPRDYCYERSIGYVFAESTQVMVHLQMITTSNGTVDVSTSDESPRPYQLDLSLGSVSLPVSFSSPLITAIEESTHLTVRNGGEILYISTGCSQENIAMFPPFRFSIMSDNREAVSIFLEPQDYVLHDERGDHCVIDIDWSADDSPRFFLGQHIFKQTTVFIDERNNRIGFCEPL